jgi:NAD(P)-dependent dehydrogenase (short-subunit alcohol dehydrogenase family)
VAATTRSPQALAELAREFGDALLPLAVDLTSTAAIEDAVAAAVARFGGIDVLVYNAGYGLLGAVEEVTDAELRTQFDVNFFGAASAARAVAPHMRAAGGGEIMLVSSSGRWIQQPLAAAYLSSKHALVGLVDALQPELAPFGIRARLVTPGTFRTSFVGGLTVSEHRVDAYAGRLAALTVEMDKLEGHQDGDPALGAEVLFEAAGDAPDVTDWIVLGSDAVEQARARLEGERESLARATARARQTDVVGA